MHLQKTIFSFFFIRCTQYVYVCQLNSSILSIVSTYNLAFIHPSSFSTLPTCTECPRKIVFCHNQEAMPPLHSYCSLTINGNTGQRLKVKYWIFQEKTHFFRNNLQIKLLTICQEKQVYLQHTRLIIWSTLYTLCISCSGLFTSKVCSQVRTFSKL